MFVLNCALLMSTCACDFENRRLLVCCCHNNITTNRANTSNFTTGKVDFLVGKKLQIMATNDGLYPGYSWKKNVSFAHICLTKLNFPFLARRAVAFGTTLDRELLPLKVPANRFGNELALRGAPNRGPGCYYNAEVVEKHFVSRSVFN